MKILEILLSFVLAIWGTATTIKWRASTWPIRIFAMLAIVAAIVIAINAINKWREEELEKKVRAMFGDINDRDGSTRPTLLIGDSESMISFTTTTGPAITTGDEGLLDIKVIAGKSFVTAGIRDVKGEFIAVINKNEWEMIDNKYDYNDDDVAFEVVTKGDHEVIFSVELKRGVARISCVLYSKYGGGIGFYSLPGMREGFMQVMVPGKEKFSLPSTVKPLFKYPRAKYYGIRAKN